MIPFGEYLPDQPVFQNPGALEAKNVRPHAQSYLPQRGLATYATNTLSARCQGMVAFLDKDGTTNIFAGNNDQLLHTTGRSFSSVTVAGGYTTGSDAGWDFAKFGEEIIAVNGVDDPQRFEMGSSTAFTTLTTDVRAYYAATVRDFLVFGDTFDGTDGQVHHRVRWSAIGNASSWTVNAATQADFQDLRGAGGYVKQLVAGEFGTIFQEFSIWRMTYVGPSPIWQFDEVLPGIGTPASWSVARYGRTTYFLGQDGFYALHDGIQLEPIGHNKVDRTFWNDADLGVDVNNLHRVYGKVDAVNRLVYWAYPNQSATNGNPNMMLIYDYVNQRWSRAEVDLEILADVLSAGLTLDQLDAVSSSLDSLSPSLDSRQWTGGVWQLGAFNTSHVMSTFEGNTLAAVIDTTEAQLAPGQRALVQEIRPVVDVSSPRIQVGVRDTYQGSVTFSASVSLNSIGFAPTLSNARYHRFRVHIPTASAWTHAQGVDVMAVPMGKY